MSLPTFSQVGTTATWVSNSGTQAVSLPATLAQGEFAILKIAHDVGVSLATPSGWNLLYQHSQGASFWGAFFYRSCSSSDGGGSVTINFAGTASTGCAQVQTFLNVSTDASYGYFDDGGGAQGTSGSPASNDFNTLGPDRLAVALLAIGRNTNATAGTGFTEPTGSDVGGSGCRVAGDTKVMNSAGAVGQDVRAYSSDDWVTYALALKGERPKYSVT